MREGWIIARRRYLRWLRVNRLILLSNGNEGREGKGEREKGRKGRKGGREAEGGERGEKKFRIRQVLWVISRGLFFKCLMLSHIWVRFLKAPLVFKGF